MSRRIQMLIRLLAIFALAGQPVLTVGWNASCAAGQASDIGVSECGPVAACCCGDIDQACGCSIDNDAPLDTPDPALPEFQRVVLFFTLLPAEFEAASTLNTSIAAVQPHEAFLPWLTHNDIQAILCIWQT